MFWPDSLLKGWCPAGHMNHLAVLLTQILTLQVWDGTQDPTFLTSCWSRDYILGSEGPDWSIKDSTVLE